MRHLTTLCALLSLAIFFLVLPSQLPSDVRADTVQCSNETECQKLIDDLSQKIKDSRALQNTLQNKLNSLANQIQLTSLQIQETQLQIASLSARIDNLEGNLNHLTDVFQRRTVETYQINSQLDPLALFLSSGNFVAFVERLKYLQVIQDSDHRLMVQLEETRTNYDDQKTLAQLLSKKLGAQKSLLEQTKKENTALLAATKNNELKYQQLLSQAQSQLAAIRQFVTLQGGASLLSNQTKCDSWGCYYNQRDSQWGAMRLGSSDLSMAEYGCLVSSTAMIAKHYGKDINPVDIASDNASFFTGTDNHTALLLYSITVKGVNIQRTSLGANTSNIDKELSAGRPVIVGLFAGPGHFIVIKGGSNGNYIMDDPFVENGAEISFSSHYQLSNITDVERVSVN